MSKIWFTSDTHYGHSNIASSSCSKWEKGYRNFDNLDQMNETIVKNINKLVLEDDILYHLGDWSFGGIENIWNFRKQIRCKNIHLVLGNHDEHIRNNKVLPNVIRSEPYSQVLIDGTNTDHEYPNYVEAKELFTSVQDVLTVKHGHHTFYMSHYSHRVWYGHNKGVIHLYGHSHSNLEKSSWGKSMDVGIDNAYKLLIDTLLLLAEYRPFSIEEVVSLMYSREIFFPDHHNSNTNIK